MLNIVTLVLGPVQTNAYLAGDTEAKEAVVIDPAWEGELIVEEAQKHGWKITQVWVTHAHFDHFGGAAAVVRGCNPPPEVALHPDELPLWQMQGGAPLFGLQIEPGPQPTVTLSHRQVLRLGQYAFEVRHTPGHTEGHVIFYCARERLTFCGDVIFRNGIGRTDLPGGDYETLMTSIREQVFSLPDETRLLSGHGPETKVGLEKAYFA
ncbi:MAG: MBL fold metallo-hydrolase [Candidatus Methanoperedens sp.]|nr:MBL fold metallo-hydrolase [Candidatus Methanoperedens sp.]